MRILVTGAAGYIGSTLVPFLLTEKHQVIVVDKFYFNNEHVFFQWLQHTDLEIYREDVRNYEEMKRLYNKADLIIPLAAIVGEPACSRYPKDALEINQNVIIDMIKYLSPGQKVIFPNTNSGYGSRAQGMCYEFEDLKPISLYGKTKCIAENAVLNHPFSTVFRLATVCGVSPRMRFDLMLNDFAAKLYQVVKNPAETFTIFEPEFQRNFVHIKDVARAFIWMLMRETGVYNLGNPSMNMSKIQLAKTISSYYGLSPNVIKVGDGKDPDQRNYLVSNEKIMRTGFEFIYPMWSVLAELTKICSYCTPAQIAQMRNI